MTHYRAVQPTPATRVGVAEFPRQIVRASEWLWNLSGAVPRELADRRTLVTWPMRDMAFRARRFLPRFRLTFSDLQIIELKQAKHYFVEDAPRDVADALSARFT